MTDQVTDNDFQSQVLESTVPVLVDFWAQWCGPCRMLAPVIDELNTELKGRIKVCKMDIENNPSIPSDLGIRSIPTLILFKDGKQLGMRSGVQSKDVIIDWINSLV